MYRALHVNRHAPRRHKRISLIRDGRDTYTRNKKHKLSNVCKYYSKNNKAIKRNQR